MEYRKGNLIDAFINDEVNIIIHQSNKGVGEK